MRVSELIETLNIVFADYGDIEVETAVTFKKEYKYKIYKEIKNLVIENNILIIEG